MACVNSNATTECFTCGYMNLIIDDGEGFTYCKKCGTLGSDIPEQDVAVEDLVDGSLYKPQYSRVQLCSKPSVQTLSQSQSLYKTLSQVAVDIEGDQEALHDLRQFGPTKPVDFGSGQGEGLADEDYCKEITLRYVLGIQLMIQHQCEVLVDKFGVCSMICGISGSIWLRYVASLGIFAEDWGDQVMFESERRGKISKGTSGNKDEPRSVLNQRMVVIWYRSLRKRIPLSCSLAVAYLACHVAREPIIPTDIQRWSVEGKLPYLSVFTDIEKFIGSVTTACPIKASSMFRPSQIVPPQKLESLAASIAESIQLSLPPINFYPTACRYLNQLSLPAEKICPYAVRLYEWCMPPDLWLSTNDFTLPPRTCVMAILVVTIRIVYNLNGFGKWEASFSDHANLFSKGEGKGSEDLKRDDIEKHNNGLNSVFRSEYEAQELLCNLERNYAAVNEKYEHSKDLPSYLQYCKDVVFAGLEPLYEDHVEEKMINQFWDFYMKENKGSEMSAKVGRSSEQKRERGGGTVIDIDSCDRKRLKEGEENTYCSLNEGSCGDAVSEYTSSLSEGTSSGDAVSEWYEGAKSVHGSQKQNSGNGDELSSNLREVSMRLLKLDMEENRFCYIPPREYVKRADYLHYARKRNEGSLLYVANADYYILLRACAKAAEVDMRIMHLAVLKLERRLAKFEDNIDRFCGNLF